MTAGTRMELAARAATGRGRDGPMLGRRPLPGAGLAAVALPRSGPADRGPTAGPVAAQILPDGNRHDLAHAGRLGKPARAIASVARVRRGDRLRLRLINAATARVFPLEIAGVAGRIVALDGMPPAAPREIGGLALAPAQRVDIIADITDTVRFGFPMRQGPCELGRIAAEGDDPAPARGPVGPLPAAAVALPARPARRLALRMEGGVPGGLRDTTLVAPGETRAILCRFDNPGRWLLHCRMPGHQAAGMKTWVAVA